MPERTAVRLLSAEEWAALQTTISMVASIAAGLRVTDWDRVQDFAQRLMVHGAPGFVGDDSSKEHLRTVMRCAEAMRVADESVAEAMRTCRCDIHVAERAGRN